MGKKDQQVCDFAIEGRFLGFIVEDGYKLKYLRLATAQGEKCLKLTAEARASVGQVLVPGDWIQVWGKQTIKSDTQTVKLKAYEIRVVTSNYPLVPVGKTQSLVESPLSSHSASLPSPLKPMGDLCSTPLSAPSTSKPSKGQKSQEVILVCQKSDCMKRGGKGVCKALESALSDRGLEGQVTIQATGCMKHCKAGPNVVFMPDKTRYSRITAAEIPALVDKHFPIETPPDNETWPEHDHQRERADQGDRPTAQPALGQLSHVPTQRREPLLNY